MSESLEVQFQCKSSMADIIKTFKDSITYAIPIVLLSFNIYTCSWASILYLWIAVCFALTIFFVNQFDILHFIQVGIFEVVVVVVVLFAILVLLCFIMFLLSKIF